MSCGLNFEKGEVKMVIKMFCDKCGKEITMSPMFNGNFGNHKLDLCKECFEATKEFLGLNRGGFREMVRID